MESLWNPKNAYETISMLVECYERYVGSYRMPVRPYGMLMGTYGIHEGAHEMHVEPCECV